MNKLDITTKIDSYVYACYPGVFTYPDSKSKVPLKKGEKLFVDIVYESTYLLPKFEKNGLRSCFLQSQNMTFDDCFQEVLKLIES